MRRRNRKGFTLAELLIVVAVIAVLTAVAIPTFSDQLEKSRQAVDIASLRDAYAIAKMAEITQMFNDEETLAAAADNALGLTCWCDPDSGQLIEGPTSELATVFAARSGENLLGHATTTVARLNIDSLSAIPNYQQQLSYNDLYKGTTQKAIAVHFAKNAQSEYTVNSVYYAYTLRAWGYLLLPISTINDHGQMSSDYDWSTNEAKLIRKNSPIIYDVNNDELTFEDIELNKEQNSSELSNVASVSALSALSATDVALYFQWLTWEGWEDEEKVTAVGSIDGLTDEIEKVFIAFEDKYIELYTGYSKP